MQKVASQQKHNGNKMKVGFLVDKDIKKIISSKTPEKFVDRLLKSNLDENEKKRVTKQWLEATGYKNKDITTAKKEHSHWKERLSMDRNEKTKQRFVENDFSIKAEGKRSRRWLEDDLKLFLKLNEDHTDRELAQKLQRSIPSIQGIRRRYNLGKKIIHASNEKRVSEKRWLYFVSTDEKKLRKDLEEALGGDLSKASKITTVLRGRKIKK